MVMLANEALAFFFLFFSFFLFFFFSFFFLNRIPLPRTPRKVGKGKPKRRPGLHKFAPSKLPHLSILTDGRSGGG